MRESGLLTLVFVAVILAEVAGMLVLLFLILLGLLGWLRNFATACSQREPEQLDLFRENGRRAQGRQLVRSSGVTDAVRAAATTASGSFKQLIGTFGQAQRRVTERHCKGG
jgi:hypothetical protein